MADILIVEPDDELRIAVCAALVQSGHRVHEAARAMGARAAIRRILPDLAVVADDLPDRSSRRCLAEFRDLAPSAPILLLMGTDRSSDEDEQRRLGGVVEVLRKPMERLQRQYRARLTERLAELRSALWAARHAGTGSHEFQNAKSLVHRLRGSAGSFGLPVVSVFASLIEAQLERLQDGAGDGRLTWSLILESLAGAAGHIEPAAPCVPTNNWRSPGLRVLVVDDDPDCRAIVTLVGRAASLDVIETASTGEALAVASREPVDVVLLDLHLGQHDDAFSACAELRRCTGRWDLPIAAFSADTSVENRLAASRAGADVFLAKPIDTDELALTVRRLVDVRNGEPHRVLIVDDDPTSAAALARLLGQQGWLARSLCDASRIFEMLDTFRPDLLLLDVHMPVSGFDICRIVRASPAWRELAIVFVTGSMDRDTLIQCYKVGGDDCMSKPVVPAELRARLTLRLERARVFRQLAHEDPLAGLMTREAFSTAVARRLSEALRHSRPLTVVLLDLDRFKSVNDTHGHLAGDRVLRALGQLLGRAFRVEDFRARWGGEEFVLALYEADAESSAQAVERALEDFRDLVFEGDAGELFCCSFSAGVAQFPDDGDTLNQLMQLADARLYAAKAAGRARVICVDDAVPSSRTSGVLRLRAGLHEPRMALPRSEHPAPLEGSGSPRE